MANYNLTSQQIKDTYEQLVQVSGSALVDGEGNNISVLVTSASHAVTASYAENALAEWDEIANKPSGLVSSSAQVDLSQATGTATSASYAVTASHALNAADTEWDSILNKPSGLVSSSAQIADDISGSFTSTSASLAADIATNKSDISTQTSRVDSLVSATSSYAVKNSNNTFTGTQTFDNIAVNGTGSFAYIQSVTGSAKIIGDAYIVLNNNTPAERYAGVKVYDSGSTNNSASFEFDGQTNDWFYEYTDDGGATEEFGVVMFGPGYNTRGAHVYPANNTILKGTGDHHIADSNIVDDGSEVSITGPVSASTYRGDGSNLTGIDIGLVPGTSAGSMRSSDTLTTNPAAATGINAIALGDSATAASTNAIAIGNDATAAGPSAIAIGDRSFAEQNGVAVGIEVTASSQFSVALGLGADATAIKAIAIGADSSVGASAVASGVGSISIGNTTEATDTQAISIGYDSIASDPNVIAIGTRANAPAENGISIGIDSDASGFSGIALGELTVANSDDTVAIGTRAEATNNNAIAIGRGAGAGGSKAVAIGFAADAGGDFSVALGDEANAGGSNSFAQAAAASAAGNHSIAFGELASAGQDHSIVMGQGAASTATNGIAIGSGSSVSSANEINIAGIFKYDGSSDVTFGTATAVDFGENITSVTSGSATGSLIDNVHPAIASGSTAIKHIVTIDQTAYDTISGSGNVSDDTFYIIEDAGDNVYPGNLQVSGQIYTPTFAGSVASSTSSIDFDNGNFATLSLSAATFLANPSNLQSGTTYTLIITSGSQVSNYGTSWKFAGGTQPTLSDGTDILTCVSDGTNLYATALADFS